MAREFGVSFSLGANLDGSFGSAFRSANGQIANVTNAIREMEKTPVGKIGASMLAQREKSQKLVGSLKEVKGQLAGYWAEAERTGNITGTLAAQIERAERKVASLKGRLYQSNAAFREQNAEAVKVSGSVTKLRHDYDALSAAMNRAKNHRDVLGANIARKNALRDQRSDLNGRLIGGAAQAATVAIPVKLAVSAEDTFADLKKVMDGADDELLGQVYQDALKMSSETGKSFEDVVSIMTAGAQAGLGKTREEMRANTEQAVQMSVAWGVSAEQAGKSLATWRSSMGMTSDEARHTADVINALSNKMNGEAGEIDQIFTRMGPLMKGSGLAAQDIAALGMAFKASGSQVEVAGTAMKNFSKVLTAGNAMTKDQKDVFSRLGLDPKQMQKMMQADPKAAIMKLLTQLKRVPKEMQNAVSMKLFGDESIAAIAPLLDNLGLLTQAFEIANSNVDNSALEEYRSRMETTATEQGKLAQQTRNLGITVGNAALPAYNAFLKTMSKGVGVITGFAKEYPNVTTALLGGVGALAALTVGGIVFGYAYNGLATTFNAVQRGLLLMRGATVANTVATTAGTQATLLNRAAHLSWSDVAKGSVGTARSMGTGLLGLIGIQKNVSVGSVWAARGMGALNKASKILKVGLGALKFAFGPVGIAIAVIGGAAYWLIENWDAVGPYFSKAWDWICGIFKSAANVIKGIVDWVFGAVDAIAKKWTESETIKRNAADALNMNFGDWQGGTPEEGEKWVGGQKKDDAIAPPPDAVGPKPDAKGPDKPAGPKPMEVPKQVAGMPSGEVPNEGTLDTFGDFGDESEKKGKKGGKKGRGPGPVTVVSLDSGNKFHTVFIPAASKEGKSSSNPVGSSVLAPSASGQSETVAFSKAGQGLIGGLNKTFDRLPKLFDASLSKVTEPDIPPAVVNVSSVSASPQPVARPVFHPVQRQDRSGSAFAVLRNAATSIPDTWSRTINTKMERASVPPVLPLLNERNTPPPVLPQTPMLLEQNKRTPERREREAPVSDIQIVQHFNVSGENVNEFKKELRRLEPEFEKLVRRALDKMRSDKARTAHAQ